MEILYNFIVIIIGAFIGGYLSGYLKKSGEYLAMKENIKEITDKIESVKHEYSKELEQVKADLATKINTSSFRYQKEYEVLCELAERITDLGFATYSLRPNFDSKDSTKSENEIKYERLNKYYNAWNALLISSENKRPFYSDEIYNVIDQIRKLARKEASEYEIYHNNPIERMPANYWDNATATKEKMERAIEEIVKKMRERTRAWE